MVISGIFCGIVALLLILNFWHMKQTEPLESQAIEALVKRLSQEPNNEELKEEIRSFDLLARKAYFTSRWQVKTGTWLLLIGGIVLAVSMKFYTDLRAGHRSSRRAYRRTSQGQGKCPVLALPFGRADPWSFPGGCCPNQ